MPTLFIYSLLTYTSVCYSLTKYSSLSLWLKQEWTVMLLWNMQFHTCHLITQVSHLLFLGRLRMFEKRQSREKFLYYMVNCAIFVAVVCGFDLKEAFCWMLWLTPGGFHRMSLGVIKERIDNPPISSSSSSSPSVGTREGRPQQSGNVNLAEPCRHAV
eukprot:GHVU01119509.1.p1 GENE.GHVU01119509.1~~GHVU01119509.1.p1  ORF type:complete len:158 (+),score=31.48 GHVU01119509.1:293-766(+)